MLVAKAVISKTSIPFLRTVFDLYERRQLFAIVSSREAAGKISGISFDEFIDPAEGTGWFDGHHSIIREPGHAQISLTSGTTGVPKGILLRHDALADVVVRLNEAMEIDSGIREYVGVPANFSFGLGRFRAVAAAGGKAYLPPQGFDPIEIARMLAENNINALSAVPTLLRLLLDHRDVIGEAGRAMRWIEIGSQHMTGPEKSALRELFSEAKIIQHYGLTEASRTTFLDISSAPASLLESVGEPVGETQIDLDGQSRIRIRGPHVARERIDEEGIHSLLDADGWLVTNDIGEIKDGHLFFKGRSDDLINCGGVKLVPDVIEEQLRGRLAIPTGIAVARVPDAMRGDGVLVAVERGTGLDAAAVRAAAIEVLARFGLSPGNALHIASVDAIPVTATGKLRRAILAESVPLAISTTASDGAPKRLSEEILALLNVGLASRDRSFIALGGDSLSYVQVTMLIDAHLGHLPDGWEKIPLAELDELDRIQGKGRATIDTSVLVRAVAILTVVLDHAWADAAGGASLALMMVAGLNFSRFQVPRIRRGGALELLTATFWRVLLPYFAFVSITFAYHHRMFWPQYLLFANFTKGVYNADGERLLVPYWFMEDYLLYVLIFTIAISIPTIGRIVERAPWRVSYCLFLPAAILGIVGVFLRDIPLFYEPTLVSVAWMFALGWIVHQADRPRRKYFVLIAAMLPILIITPMDMIHHLRGYGLSGGEIATGGMLTKLAVAIGLQLISLWLLLFVPRVSLFKKAAHILSTIAAASLYIYMSHPFVLHFVSQKGTLPMALLAVAASAVVGIALWKMFELGEKIVSGLISGVRIGKTPLVCVYGILSQASAKSRSEQEGRP